jgi:hypothetical protein
MCPAVLLIANNETLKPADSSRQRNIEKPRFFSVDILKFLN